MNMIKQIMNVCVSGYKKGLTVNQIKWIALIFMTIDHLGAYGFPIPIFDKYFELLRILGRIAAPLFLFVVTESVKHTRNKWKFVLRLYLGAVAVGLFVTVTNFLFDDSIGRFTQSNILFTYFYIALYIVLIEQIIDGVKKMFGFSAYSEIISSYKDNFNGNEKFFAVICILLLILIYFL